MNWKKRFEELKVGDRVKLISPCPSCGSMSAHALVGCTEDNIGQIGNITNIMNDDKYGCTFYGLGGHHTLSCSFQRIQLEKVLQ